MAITLRKTGTILLAKGLDTSIPAEYIQEQFALNSINFNMVAGELFKRKGFKLLGDTTSSTGSTIMAGLTFTREGATYNIRVKPDAIEKYNTSTTAWDSICTTLTGTLDDLIDTAIPLLSGNPILCVSNGVDNIQSWTATGNTADLGGTPPVPKFIQEYKTYLVCANIAGGIDIPERVQWSNTADPENWTSGNAGAVDLIEDNSEITGLNLFGDYLCVHKENSIYLGYLTSSTAVFQFSRKNTGVGTIANGTIINLPTGEQVFLATNGLNIFNGINCSLIDAPINDEIRTTLNREFAHRSWAILLKDRDEVWFGIPTGSEEVGQTIYKFNYSQRTIYKNVIADISCAWIGRSDDLVTWDDLVGTWDEQTWNWNDSTITKGSDVLHIGNTDGATLIEGLSLTGDNSIAINAFYDSKDFQNDQESVSRFTELQVWAKGAGELDVYYSIDQGVSWSSIGNSPLVLQSEYPTFDSPQILYFDVVSTQIRFRFQNNSSTDSVVIKQFICAYRSVGFRR